MLRSKLMIGMATFALFAMMSIPASAEGPSYSCRGNLNPTERAICDNATLSDLDRAMANRFYALRDRLPRSEATRLRETQNRWRGARDRCGRDAACVGSLYGQRIAEIRAWGGQAERPAPRTERVERNNQVVIYPDGTWEKPGPDGKTYRRGPDGRVVTVLPDGRVATYRHYTQVPYAGLPELPSDYRPWTDSLNTALADILDNILTPQEYGVYQSNEGSAERNTYQLLDYRLRSIDFLTGEGAF